MGMYGGIAAICDQLNPISIFGIPGDFQSVPIVLSILYGKRRAGLIAVGILVAYQVISRENHAVASIAALLVYSSLPFFICHRFAYYSREKRRKTAIYLSLVVLVVQLVTIVALVFIFEPNHVLTFEAIARCLLVAVVLQFVLMTGGMLIVENIIQDGRDRTELVESRYALEVSNERYQSFVEYNPNGVCAFDLDHRVQMANTAYLSMIGYCLDELTGLTRFDMSFPEDHPLVHDLRERAIRGEIARDIETKMRHKSGQAIPIRLTQVPIVLKGECVGYYSVVADITEERMAEELVRKSDKLATVGQLAAGVAHEIRNPLTSIKGFLKLIERDPAGSKQYFSIVNSELSRIDLISSQLLVLAKPQVEKSVPVDVDAAIRDVAVLMKPQANLANVSIRTHSDDGMKYVLWDENQIRQVFMNIVKNALEATPVGGTVTLMTKSTGDEVQIVIEDTGIGMTQETIKRLGEPFYTTKGNGTGLGLMVSHRMIDRHGGTIHYDSIPGQGTRVTVELTRIGKSRGGLTQGNERNYLVNS
ncbi:ATP-binding protein [Alicyclobacillus dauci]|uniref:histidine kinase n=1 Tax=Alicyclobacillus dauci TaxID=1475485 RepID=A0ABY6Z4T9_9BACL|nr:ATP-binding protein [Alicyclobacillus dauci]WAH37780.1 ATP-binding protein [Alicyclobacillus dauci]